MTDEQAWDCGGRVQVLWSRGTATAGTVERLVLEGLRRWQMSVMGLELLHVCPMCGTDRHGRPILSSMSDGSPHVSLSRAGIVTVVALSDSGPVGVDIEAVGAAGFTGFGPVALHPRERARSGEERTVTWVRKEAVVKATGQGLTVDLTRVRVGEPVAPPDLLEWSAADPPAVPVWLYDAQTAPDHVTAVAVLAATRPRLLSSQEVGARQAP